MSYFPGIILNWMHTLLDDQQQGFSQHKEVGIIQCESNVKKRNDENSLKNVPLSLAVV